MSYSPDGKEHQARVLVWPSPVIAATLTAFRDIGIAVAVAAALAWVLFVFIAAGALAHRWDECSVCTAPPKREATAEARRALARRVHTRWRRVAWRLALPAMVIHAAVPKPYLDGIGAWRLAVAGAYAAFALLMYSTLRNVGVHQRHRGECHLERCRAGIRPQPSAWHRAVAHYGVWVMLIFIPALCVLGLLAHRQDQLRYLDACAVLVFSYIMLTIILFHTEELCPICAARIPANAAEVAEERHFWLRTAHRTRVTAPVAACVLWVASWVVSGTAPGRVLLTAGGVLLVGWMVLTRVHGQVQPWCPWCRDDGGDPSPDSTPDPSGNRPRPAPA